MGNRPLDKLGASDWPLACGCWLLARGQRRAAREDGRCVLFFSVLFVLFLSLASSAVGQIQANDSTMVKTDSVAVKSPNWALFRSAVLPGWGQWYNGKKFKSLLVLGGEVGLIVNASFQNQKALRSKTEDERAFYENNRSLSAWWAVAVYFLNLLDAYVDAQLSDFDVGPDLSWRSSEFGGKAVLLSMSWRLAGTR
jgi:hypothetical protein